MYFDSKENQQQFITKYNYRLPSGNHTLGHAMNNAYNNL